MYRFTAKGSEVGNQNVMNAGQRSTAEERGQALRTTFYNSVKRQLYREITAMPHV